MPKKSSPKRGWPTAKDHIKKPTKSRLGGK